MTKSPDASDAIFAALADPVRRAIVASLCDRPASVHTLAQAFPISRPAVSRHLRRLKEAGLVELRSPNRKDVYRLRPEALAPLDLWLERYRGFWDSRLRELASRFEDS